MFVQPIYKVIVPMLLLTLVGVPAVALGTTIKSQAPKALTTTYYYNADKEEWVRNVEAIPLPPNDDSSVPQNGNTIIIRVNANNPVREIHIEQALVINSNNSTPLLEINGSNNSSGKINIGTLIFDTVEAERLDIDADVVRTVIENVAAEDNELDLDLEVVNVVRTGRGGSSKLVIGANPTDDPQDSGEIIILNANKANKTGVRADRIRILGPSSGTAFVEKIIVKRSSVFGRIEVTDVAIQDLIIRNVSLDDSP